MKKIADPVKLLIQPTQGVINDTDTFDNLRYTSSVETKVANILNLKIYIQPTARANEDHTISVIFFGTAGQVISESFILKNIDAGMELSLSSLKPEYEIIDVNRIAFRSEKKFEAKVTVYDISKPEGAAVQVKED
ncbi:MAG: hypothetical protein H0W73_17500 [Bacteroidetes bacterium]|nr:hypothetical protein [Bacteroidota bacterium]